MKFRVLVLFFATIFCYSPVSAKTKKHSHTHRRGHLYASHHYSRRHHAVHHSTFVPIKVDTVGVVWGLDISHHQQNVDWDKLKQKQPGFVFLKATEGATNQDDRYDRNYVEAKKSNIPVGSYHFFSYKCSGKEQAQNFLSKLQFNKGDLPPVLDLEFHRRMPSVGQVQAELLDFINIVSSKLACPPIIYCNNRFYARYLQACLPQSCLLWIVDYKAQPTGNWTFWQTSDKHTISGISGFVDLNIFNGNRMALAAILAHPGKN